MGVFNILNTDIYEYDLYVNKSIPYIFNNIIIEYDIKEAGFNMLRENNMFTDKELDDLVRHTKKERHIMIGKMELNKPKIKEKLKELFKEYRKKFFIENDISENEIISIKKDAIFVTKPCYCLEFGKNIKFVPKNEYTSYVRLNNKYELYYSSDKIDVKGIRDENVKLHEDYMMKILKTFFHKMEVETNEDVLRYLRRVIDKYKFKTLDVGFYREFNSNSEFKYLDNSYEAYAWDENIKDLDISYNMLNILVKLVKIAL